MATVFRATRRADGRILAIKVLHPELKEVLGPGRFHREVEILSRLNHPAILPVLESGEESGFVYYGMPFVTGETLRARLRREVQLPIEEAISLTRSVLAPLSYAHGQNIIHRDIKPENILFQEGRPFLADFGIARAVVRSGGDSVSSAGIAVGTPAYMSPEQGAGESRLDGRTDIYSIGCVLYEMLSGSPPFTGPTSNVISARHAHERPPPLRIVRPTVSELLQRTLEKALEKVPADRYQSAAEFAAALERCELPSRGEPSTIGRAVSRYRWALTAAAAAIAIAAATILRDGGTVDPKRYVVLPFRDQRTRLTGPISADNATRLVWRNLHNRWSDLALVDELLVEDQIQTHGHATRTCSDGAALARTLNAGRMICGDLLDRGDSVFVRASLLDVGSRKLVSLRQAEVPVSPGPESAAIVSARFVETQLSKLARSLLLDMGGQAGLGDSVAGTSSYYAWLATLSGDSARARWDLDAAREKYRQAFTLDPSYALPRLRFALASLWADDSAAVWLPAAQAALLDSFQLEAPERREAQALVALGRGDYGQACQRFRGLIADDSLRPAGWFGLGECLTRDNRVVRDAKSPSGWRFRSDYGSGIAAFERALTLVPLAHVAYGGAALYRLSNKLLLESDVLRQGVALADPPRKFGAYPAIQGDSVVFVPYPLEEVVAGKHRPSTWAQALGRNRLTLLTITSSWLARYPNSTAAMMAQAKALELNGNIGAPIPEGRSALTLVHRIRSADADSRTDVRLASWEARLLVKARRFSAARRLADTALGWLPKNSDDGRAQAGLAALTGRIDLAADLLARFETSRFGLPGGISVTAPPPVAAEAQRLLGYASFGGPADSLHRILKRLEVKVERYVEAARRSIVLRATVFRPSLLAFPALAPPAIEEYSLARIERAIFRGDKSVAWQELDALVSYEQIHPTVAVPADFVVLEARLRAELGDSGSSRRSIERLLDDLTSLDIGLLDEIPEAAAIGRAMVLYRALGGDSKGRGLDTALTALWGAAPQSAVRSP